MFYGFLRVFLPTWNFGKRMQNRKENSCYKFGKRDLNRKGGNKKEGRKKGRKAGRQAGKKERKKEISLP